MNTKLAGVLMCAIGLGELACAGDGESHTAGAAGAVASGTAAEHAGEAASACDWPSSLAPLSSTTREVCKAARAFLSCVTNNGGADCVSDDFTTCINAEEIESPVKSCTSDCKENEYVALCGGIGPGPVPEPPDGCHQLDLVNPGGVVMYCCSCK